MAATPIPIRLEDDLVARVDRVGSALAERASGAKVTRASAIRVALDRGLSVLEAELGLNARRNPKHHK